MMFLYHSDSVIFCIFYLFFLYFILVIQSFNSSNFIDLDKNVKGFIQIGETQHEIYNAPNKTKVPETLFYNNYQVGLLEFDLYLW